MRTANDPGEDGLDDEAFTQLVVQFPIRGHGTVEDLDFRHQVEDILDQALRSARLGHIDGGDIGSGTINVFAIVGPSAWEQAWAVIRTELARRNPERADFVGFVACPWGSVGMPRCPPSSGSKGRADRPARHFPGMTPAMPGTPTSPSLGEDRADRPV